MALNGRNASKHKKHQPQTAAWARGGLSPSVAEAAAAGIFLSSELTALWGGTSRGTDVAAPSDGGCLGGARGGPDSVWSWGWGCIMK